MEACLPLLACLSRYILLGPPERGAWGTRCKAEGACPRSEV